MTKVKQFSLGYNIYGSYQPTDINLFTQGDFFNSDSDFLYIKNIYFKIWLYKESINYLNDESYQKYYRNNGEEQLYQFEQATEDQKNDKKLYKFYKYNIGSIKEFTVNSNNDKVKTTNKVFYTTSKTWESYPQAQLGDGTPELYVRNQKSYLSFAENKYNKDFKFFLNGDKRRPIYPFIDGKDMFFLETNGNQKISLLQFDEDTIKNIMGGPNNSKGLLRLILTYETAD